ncbi:MAG: hypothetical protein ACYCSQ_09960 [bacterium]
MKNENEEYSEHKLHIILNIIMFIWGIYIILTGFSFLIHTTGRVSGSNFGMLAAIVNMLSQLLILAGIKAIDIAVVVFDDKRPELLILSGIKAIKNQLNKNVTEK